MSKNKKVFLYLTSTIVTAAFANFAAISCNQQDNTKPEPVTPTKPDNTTQTKTEFKAPKATLTFNATAWNTATATVSLESPFILKSEWNSELEENKQVFSTENTVNALLILSDTEANTDGSKYITVSAKLSNTDEQDKKARTHLKFNVDKLQAATKYYFNSLQLGGETYLFNEVAEKSMIKNTDKSTLSFTTLTKSGEEPKPEISSWEAPKATLSFDSASDDKVMAHVVLDSPFILKREWDKTKEKDAQEINQANTATLKITLVTSLDADAKKQYITASTNLSNATVSKENKARTKADFEITGLQPGTTYFLKSFEISNASYTFDNNDEDSLLKNQDQPQFTNTGTKVKENISEWSAPKVKSIEFNENTETKTSGTLKLHLESQFILQKEWDKTLSKENQTFNSESSEVPVTVTVVELANKGGQETTQVLNAKGTLLTQSPARTVASVTINNMKKGAWYKVKSLQIDSTNYNFDDASEQKLYQDSVKGQLEITIIDNPDAETDIDLGEE